MRTDDRPKRRKTGILTRVIVALCAVGFLPLGILAYQLAGLNREAMTEQVLRTHVVAARSVAEQVEAFLEARRSMGIAVGSNPVVYEAPRSPGSLALLSGILQARADIGAVAITDLAGQEVIRAQRKDLASRMDEGLAVAGSGIIAMELGEEVWFRIDIPLPGGTALLRLLCDAERVQDFLRPAEIGTDAELALADDQGKAVLGMLSSREAVSKLFADKVRRTRTFGVLRLSQTNGPELLGAYSPVGGTPWTVLSLQPSNIAEALGRSLWQSSWSAVGMAALLTLLASAAAFRTIVHPIRHLLAAQRKLLGPSTGHGNEIDALSASFRLLRQRLKEQQALGDLFLGRYRVIDVAGSGSMGTVFRCWDPKLRRLVALKTLNLEEELQGDRDAIRREELLKEAMTAAQLSHPHIVAVYDAEETANEAFIAMEFVEGQSLRAYLECRGALPSSQTTSLGIAIAQALGAAHAKGLVHHDLKPANILLGVDGSIKLSDFGLSQFISSLNADAGVVFGTPGFLPPETLLGKGFTEKSDLFALGVTLYQCLSGVHPFQEETVQRIVIKTLEKEVDGIGRVAINVHDELDDIIMGLLEKDPLRRIDKADIVAQRLQTLAVRYRWRWEPETEILSQARKTCHALSPCFMPTASVGEHSTD